MTLSLCMIVRDEIFFIEECLEAALPYVDEVIVVDTGSKDGTREVAERLGTLVIDFEWIDDFSAARNVALDAATGDWVLVLDADEIIAPQDFLNIRSACDSSRADGYYLQQRNYTNDELQRGWSPVAADEPLAGDYKGYTTNPILRLFRRSRSIYYEGRIHEIVDQTINSDKREYLPVAIHHYAESNLGRPRQERVLRYLEMMDEELAERDDGRLFAIAGSSAMYFANDYLKAERYLSRAAELGYEPAISLEGAGEAAYRAGDIGRAQDIYRSLYSKGHRTPSLCLNLANLAVRSSDKPRAISLLQECLDLGGMGEATDNTIRANIRVLAE